MNLKEYLESLGIPSFEYVDETYNELKADFLEMAQIKSDFDIEKFTVKREGNFIAHNFHFLMRQFSLTLSELRRMLIRKKELERDIQTYKKDLENGKKKIFVYLEGNKTEKWTDLYIDTLLNELDLLELNIADKAIRVDRYMKMRKALIKINGGKITNEQYQAENPQYWAWFLKKKAYNQYRQAKTGIHEGVWENVDYLEENPIINENFKVQLTDHSGFIPFESIIKEIRERRAFDYHYDEHKKLLDNNGFKQIDKD